MRMDRVGRDKPLEALDDDLFNIHDELRGRKVRNIGAALGIRLDLACGRRQKVEMKRCAATRLSLTRDNW